MCICEMLHEKYRMKSFGKLETSFINRCEHSGSKGVGHKIHLNWTCWLRETYIPFEMDTFVKDSFSTYSEAWAYWHQQNGWEKQGGMS